MKKNKNEKTIFDLTKIGDFFFSVDILLLEKFAVVLLYISYVILPIDIIPDLIPLLGFADDISILSILVLYCNWRMNSLLKKDVPKMIDVSPVYVDENPTEESCETEEKYKKNFFK